MVHLTNQLCNYSVFPIRTNYWMLVLAVHTYVKQLILYFTLKILRYVILFTVLWLLIRNFVKINYEAILTWFVSVHYNPFKYSAAIELYPLPEKVTIHISGKMQNKSRLLISRAYNWKVFRCELVRMTTSGCFESAVSKIFPGSPDNISLLTSS
jgi:hypothetical protein